MGLFGDNTPKSSESKSSKMEAIQKIIESLRPIDDTMFQQLMENTDVCTEILRTILDDPALVVKSKNTQKSIGNLRGRSVILDAFCELCDGKLVNIEVQRANNDNHQKRVRYNASLITANTTNTGTPFSQVPDLIMIYISEFDIFRKGRNIYHVERFIKEDHTEVDNGLHEIYLVASKDFSEDVSKLGKLLTCFLLKDLKAYKKDFPNLVEEFTILKDTKTEGGSIMNQLLMERDRQRDLERDLERAKQCYAAGVPLETIISIFGVTEKDLVSDAAVTEKDLED